MNAFILELSQKELEPVFAKAFFPAASIFFKLFVIYSVLSAARLAFFSGRRELKNVQL